MTQRLRRREGGEGNIRCLLVLEENRSENVVKWLRLCHRCIINKPISNVDKIYTSILRTIISDLLVIVNTCCFLLPLACLTQHTRPIATVSLKTPFVKPTAPTASVRFFGTNLPSRFHIYFWYLLFCFCQLCLLTCVFFFSDNIRTLGTATVATGEVWRGLMHCFQARWLC